MLHGIILGKSSKRFWPYFQNEAMNIFIIRGYKKYTFRAFRDLIYTFCNTRGLLTCHVFVTTVSIHPDNLQQSEFDPR